MPTPFSARLQLIAAALLFSTGGAAIKYCTLTGWQIACFRSATAAAAVWILMPASRQRWTPRAVAVGAAYGATMILFVLSNKLTTAANSIFLQSTAPLYVMFLGPLFLKESIRRRDLLFVLVLGLGLGAFFAGGDRPVATAPDPAAGNLLAAFSGVSWALTVVGLRWIARGSGGKPDSALVAVLVGNVFVFLLCLPMALPVHGSQASDWMGIAYLGVFQIGLAYVCLTSGIRRVGSLEASLLLLIEPVLNPVWAWMVHGEVPGPWPLAGGTLILCATALRTLLVWRESVVRR